MKAKEIMNKALARLGYTASDGNEQLTRRIQSNALDTVNGVYADVWRTSHTTDFVPLNRLDDEINLPAKATAVMIYGVAAFIAQSENDGDQQQWWISVYNDKLKTLSVSAERQDVLPGGYGL